MTIPFRANHLLALLLTLCTATAWSYALAAEAEESPDVVDQISFIDEGATYHMVDGESSMYFDDAECSACDSGFVNDLAGVGCGAAVPLLGRIDAQSRLNIFDTQTAAPNTRGWYSFRFAENYSIGSVHNAASVSGLNSDKIERPNQIQHRLGFEYAMSENFSAGFQGAYIVATDQTVLTDHWANPQVQLKQVIHRDACNLVSVVLAGQFQNDAEDAETREDTAKIYPGLMAFHALSARGFLQGGVQLGIPTEGAQVSHVDWAMGYGRFLFKDSCWSPCDPCSGCAQQQDCTLTGNCDRLGFFNWLRYAGGVPIRAVIAQVEFYGKHVLQDETYELEIGDRFSPSRVFVDEGRDVVDVTIGSTLLIGKNSGLSSGASFPITGREVRDMEAIVSVWKEF